ncbi:hypothetical protein E4U47_004708 [Claviceps purpurea]|nr:hypothetical protein E4U36_000185 [Claviceps purpurea]KAG6244114.1 hypothetical protein E4U23_006344 [Claviceps purpurea]KAG6260858.1 hypothetical protein E4U49_004454 [Claviceps purpurea]KAG6268353.1 hypothetical protein E4U47_004708 [Claviceps purpurea]
MPRIGGKRWRGTDDLRRPCGKQKVSHRSSHGTASFSRSGRMSIIKQSDGSWMPCHGGQMAGATFGQGKSGPSPTRRSAHSEFPKPIHLDAGYYKVGKVHDMG